MPLDNLILGPHEPAGVTLAETLSAPTDPIAMKRSLETGRLQIQEEPSEASKMSQMFRKMSVILDLMDAMDRPPQSTIGRELL